MLRQLRSNIAVLHLNNQYVKIYKHLSDKGNYPFLWPIRLVFFLISLTKAAEDNV